MSPKFNQPNSKNKESFGVAGSRVFDRPKTGSSVNDTMVTSSVQGVGIGKKGLNNKQGKVFISQKDQQLFKVSPKRTVTSIRRDTLDKKQAGVRDVGAQVYSNMNTAEKSHFMPSGTNQRN